MTSKSKKNAKQPAKKKVTKKAMPTGRQAVTKKKKAANKNATAIKKPVAKKNTPTAKKAVAKKPVIKKKAAVKKRTPVKKSIATKKATPQKIIKKTVVIAEVPKEKVASPEIDIQVEAVASHNPLTEEKSIVEQTVITELPVPDKNTRQGKFARNYDKHQIQLSSVKKGGPKPSGKKPLW